MRPDRKGNDLHVEETWNYRTMLYPIMPGMPCSCMSLISSLSMNSRLLARRRGIDERGTAFDAHAHPLGAGQVVILRTLAREHLPAGLDETAAYLAEDRFYTGLYLLVDVDYHLLRRLAGFLRARFSDAHGRESTCPHGFLVCSPRR